MENKFPKNAKSRRTVNLVQCGGLYFTQSQIPFFVSQLSDFSISTLCFYISAFCFYISAFCFPEEEFLIFFYTKSVPGLSRLSHKLRQG